MDTGIMELDKLIHSFEFENQQYVKMIEKETQLINSLECQMQEDIQETRRLEEEISRFDDDTKRLHRLYTSNRDNIDNLKSTINVLSDHEVALSRQLEITRTKTEDNGKLYKTHIANYSSTVHDYMSKYTRFSLAVDLEQKKFELNEVQSKLESFKVVKEDLKDKIATQENELNNKVMTRIVIKIAKTKQATFGLENDIHQSLAEKTDLVDKLKEIRTWNQPEQSEPCSEVFDGSSDKANMDTSNVVSEPMEDCEGHRSRDGVEEFSNMSITDDHEKSATNVNQQCTVDDLYTKKKNDGHLGDMSQISQGVLHPGMNVENNVSAILTHDDDNNQQLIRGGDLASVDNDTNNTPVSYQNNAQEMITQQSPTKIAAVASSKPLQNAKHEDHIVTTALDTTWKRTISVTPLRQVTDDWQSQKQSLQSVVATDNEELPMPLSLRVPRLYVPKPPRVLPPSVVRIPPKLPEQRILPESCSEIKQPQAPPSNMLKEIRQKMSFFTPTLPLHSSSQQNRFNTLPKTSALTSTLAGSSQAECSPLPHQSSSTQFQTRSSNFSVSGVLPSKVPKTQLSTSQIGSSIEESPLGKHNSALEDSIRGKPGMAEPTVATTTTTKETDIEVDTGGHDIPPVSSENCKTVFKVNISAGSHSPDTDLTSPKRNYSKSPSSGKSAISKNNHNSLFVSLFGNFENNSNNEDCDENDDEAAPTSIFSLFNISQNPNLGNTREDTSDSGTFLTFGKFTEETGSPTSESGPRSLLNLFMKSQNSDSGADTFAINLKDDSGQDNDKEEKRTVFKLGSDRDDKNTNYFSYRSENDEREKPLFNLF